MGLNSQEIKMIKINILTQWLYLIIKLELLEYIIKLI